MNNSEFENWQRVMAASHHKWIIDAITLLNRHELLVFQGGENGLYLRISQDGYAEIGYYKDAFPHIGEALFTKVHGNQVAGNVEDAARIVFEKLGINPANRNVLLR